MLGLLSISAHSVLAMNRESVAALDYLDLGGVCPTQV